MPRFFSGSICDNQAFIIGEDARHMALSLRMKIGERVIVCDEKGSDFHCCIKSISPEQVCLEIETVLPSEGEPTVEVTLFQAFPKGEKLELIVQKAVELGVNQIVPVLTERCISRPTGNTMEKKLVRLQKISTEAAKQSGRGRIPLITPSMAFREAADALAKYPTPLFFYENAQLSMRTALEGKFHKKIGIFIGSEGGFSPAEVDYIQNLGLVPVSLGSRILRCETAPLAALSAIMYATGNM